MATGANCYVLILIALDSLETLTDWSIFTLCKLPAFASNIFHLSSMLANSIKYSQRVAQINSWLSHISLEVKSITHYFSFCSTLNKDSNTQGGSTQLIDILQ